MNPEISNVLTQLEDWRKNKKRVHEPLPSHFWEKFTILQEKYPDINLMSLTKCNSKSWAKKVLGKSARNHKKNALEGKFILAPQIDINETGLKIAINLKLRNGIEVVVYQ